MTCFLHTPPSYVTLTPTSATRRKQIMVGAPDATQCLYRWTLSQHELSLPHQLGCASPSTDCHNAEKIPEQFATGRV